MHRLAFRSAVVALLALASAIIAPAAVAQPRPASVNITPKRLVLDRTHRTGTIFVYNQGGESGTFNIDLVDRVMLPNGQIIPVENAAAKPELKVYADDLKSAHSLVTVSPRHVTLAAGQGQTVKLMIGDLPDTATEFRSHLTISTLPQRSEGTTAEEAAGVAPNQFKVVVNSIYGLSMPVIVRAGPPDVRAAVENVRVEVVTMRANPTAPLVATPVVSFDLVRKGANSLFGDVSVGFEHPLPGDKPLAFALSMGVYAELPSRHVQLPLTHKPAAGQRVVVTFTDQDATPGKLLATSAPVEVAAAP
jgi:P pilus assembly chaperone PapD